MSAGDEQITVDWTAPSFTDGLPITGYTVSLFEDHDDDPNASHFRLDSPVAEYDVGPDIRSFTFTGLAQATFPFKEYVVEVYAKTENGTSGSQTSRAVIVTPADSVQISNLQSDEVTLTWDTLPNIGYYALSGFGRYKSLHIVGESGAVYGETTRRIAKAGMVTLFAPDIEAGITYEILIEACDIPGVAFDCQPYARVTVSTPSAPTEPVQPSDPPQTINISAGVNWIEFTWHRMPEAKEYLVEATATVAGSPWLFTVPESGAIVTGRIESLQPNTSYTFEIRSCIDRGDGLYCGIPATVTATTLKG